jgi:hypothetical protein
MHNVTLLLPDPFILHTERVSENANVIRTVFVHLRGVFSQVNLTPHL